ncbi:MFS transporter [Nocardioides sp.]|uniref:MFS transporter n=1 Tax=Nocardioides sp. TaxID=35761 RepID=UPI00273376C5|nr:MFS transporter [Nocardioides sp.]MDP3893278.1 MFS transporter [Nocardioides sp.]
MTTSDTPSDPTGLPPGAPAAPGTAQEPPVESPTSDLRSEPATGEGPVWRDRNFGFLWAGETVAQFGVQLGHIAMPVIAIELLRATELQVGILNAAGVAAFLLVGLPAGAWVDRWLKRATMIRADLVRAAAVLAVPALWFGDLLAMWHLYVVAAVIGVATVFFDVSYQSYVPILVRPEQVTDANSKLETTAQIARVAGPGVGGLLLKVISAPMLMVSDAIGYLVSAACLSRVRDHERPSRREDHGRLREDIAEGLGFVWRHDLIRRIMFCTSIGNLGFVLAFTLAPLLILRELDFDPWVMGAVFSVGAVGGIVGALATPWLGRWMGEGTLIPVSSLAMGAALAALPLAALAPSKTVAFVVLVIGEFTISFTVLAYNIMQVSMRQRVCPPRLLGRMNASIRFVVWGVMPIGALLSGVIATRVGVVPTMWVGVGITLLASAPVLFSPLLGMRRLPDRPAGA